MTKRPFGRPAALGRMEGQRAGADRIVIVCEGACTEPFYFDGMRRDLNLPNVSISGRECGSDPLSVVNFALQLFSEDPAIDKIFCVFDRDSHTNFNQAIALVEAAKGRGVPITEIPSFPSFEFWYLLHFAYTRAPVVASGGRSAGDNMLRVLRKEMADYSKERTDLWLVLRERTVQAIENARRSVREAVNDDEKNPSTHVHEFVTFLMARSAEQAD